MAENLARGRIPKAWQFSKVVMIPKPGKDHGKMKGWRPINPINCIGKLGEKVVADTGCRGLADKGPEMYGQGGAVDWAFWDVKGKEGSECERGGCYKRAREVGGREQMDFVGERIPGSPQGSSLSPVSLVGIAGDLLIWMAPIIWMVWRGSLVWLGGSWGMTVDMELFLCSCIWDRIDAGVNMEGLLIIADEEVNRIARENHLQLEDSKHEKLVLRNKRRREQKDAKWVKWIGIIMGENLTFKMHWKSRIEKPRKMFGQLNV